MIKIENLAFSYGQTPVLNNISMTLEDGKIYGLLGENGVGKTTLLSLLAGLKKAKTGSIGIDGENPYSRRPDFLGDQYFLTDEPAPQNEEAQKWARMNGKFWPRYNHGQFLQIMAELENDPAKKMNRMSAGQLKKTHIAFALACNVKFDVGDGPGVAVRDIPEEQNPLHSIEVAETLHSALDLKSAGTIRPEERPLGLAVFRNDRCGPGIFPLLQEAF